MSADQLSVSNLVTSDFDALADRFAGWKHQFHQLSAGKFSGTFQALHAGKVHLTSVTSNQVIQSRGQHPNGVYIFIPVWRGNEHAVWRGQRLSAGHIVILGPHDLVDHRTSRDYESAFLAIDAAIFQQAAARWLGADFEDIMKDKLAWRTSEQHAQALRDFIIDRIQNTQLPSESPGQMQVEHDLSESCLSILLRLLPPVPGRQDVPNRLTNHMQLVRRAEDFIMAHIAQRISILDLCDSLCVSERSLHYLFHEAHGMSPIAYVLIKRLNLVREELKSVRRSSASVSQIARKWNLRHPGEFAAAYRRLFGELPSQTIHKGK